METAKPSMTLRDRIREWLGIDEDRGIIDTHTLKGKWLESRIDELEAELSAFKLALKSKAAESVFNGDKIPDKPKTGRYVPIAQRRAQAERESIGPATHDEKVRANNARAMERAG